MPRATPSTAAATIETGELCAASQLLARFRAGSDAFRNARFKLLPSVVQGPYDVQRAVDGRGTGAVLGKALRQRFFCGEGGVATDGADGVDGAAPAEGTVPTTGSPEAPLPYMEVDVDCNSSPAAGRVVSLVKSHAGALVIDLAFVIEAQAADELPERVLGCGRLLHIALDDETAVPLLEIEGREADGGAGDSEEGT